MRRLSEEQIQPNPAPKGGLELDPEVAARQKAERIRRYKTWTVPRLRFVGFGLMMTLLPIHNYFQWGDPNWRTFGLLFSVGMALALLSWGILIRFHDLAWRGLGMDDVFLAVDVLPISMLVYFTGAEQSLLFPLYLFRVGDQTHSTFRRALFFTHLVTLAFLGTIAYAAWVAGHPVSWGREGTKAGLLYVTGFYMALTTRVAERLRKRVHESIEMTRQFNLRLVSQAEELRQAREEAEAARKAQSAFLAGTSHDLRTPLNAILLYSELLKQDAEAAGQEETVQDLNKINAAGQHLLQLLNDLLDLAKVEAGKMTLFLEDLFVPGLVEEVKNLAAPLVAQKGNTLRLEVDPVLQTLVADATRLRQILLNLLSNSAKFTEGGEITLALRPEIEEGADWVILEVRDTGLGMSPDQLGRLFQEFVQGEDSTTKKFGGTGLGLVLCQRLCALMGGEIQVTSELGKGSTFTVRLPSRPEIDSVPSAFALLPGTFQGPFGKKVLIIDDDRAFREALRRIFVQEGFEVVEAGCGEEGLQMARETQPSLITLDVVMPGIDGWTVLRTLKSEPELAGIPVFLITLAGDRSQGFALGATEYLPKPIDPRRFQEVLRTFAPSQGSLLLVEDDEDQRRALARILEGDGWRVQEAGHGRDALGILEEELARGLMPDLILLDLMMPHMDGFEFMDILGKRDPWRAIPVVVLTSADLEEAARSRLALHQVGSILPKNAYPTEKLLEIVRDMAKVFPVRP